MPRPLRQNKTCQCFQTRSVPCSATMRHVLAVLSPSSHCFLRNQFDRIFTKTGRMGERHLGDLKLKAGKSKTPDATGIDVRGPAPSRAQQRNWPVSLLTIGTAVLLFGLLLFGLLLLLRPFSEKPTPTPGYVRPSPSPNFLPSPSAQTTPTPEPLPTLF